LDFLKLWLLQPLKKSETYTLTTMKKLSIGWRLRLYFVLVNLKQGALRRIPLLFLFLLPLVSVAQQIKLEEGQNGGVGRPVISPVSWYDGNCHDENSHFIEGQSIPYRVTIGNVHPGNHTLIIEWDIRKDGKTAIDYI